MPDSLRGKRILVTRAEGQNETFSRLLAEAGAAPVEFPTIQIVPAADCGPLDAAIAELNCYRWLIFTSANGVAHFLKRLALAGKDAAALQHLRIAAVGPATAAALTNSGLTANLIPGEHIAEGLLAAITDVSGRRILLPTANIAPPVLEEGLRAKGAVVNRVTAYETRPVTQAGNLPALLPTLDALTFTSGSTARNFAALLPAPEVGQAIVACIGPATAEAARKAGLPVHVIASPYTADGLVAGLAKYYRQNALRTPSFERNQL